MRLFYKSRIKKILASSHPENQQDFRFIWNHVTRKAEDVESMRWYWYKMQELDFIHEIAHIIPKEGEQMKWLYKLSPKGQVVKNQVSTFYENSMIRLTIISIVASTGLTVKTVLDSNKIDRLEQSLQAMKGTLEQCQKDHLELQDRIPHLINPQSKSQHDSTRVVK